MQIPAEFGSPFRGFRPWPVLLVAAVLFLATGCSSGSGASRAGSQSPDVPSSSTGAAGATATGAASGASSSSTAGGGLPLVVIVDGSGSMATKDAGHGTSRIAAAKRAATSLVDAQPASVPVGLVTYGTHSSSAQTATAKKTGCRDVSVLARPVSGDRSDVDTQIRGIKESGYTPVGASLTKAVGLLGDRPGRVVLVSDGQDTCTPPDPCDSAKQLTAAHRGLTISTVGFKTGSAAGKQLSCIAGVGNGVFVTADDTASLMRRLGATADTTAARRVVTSTGLGSAQIGQSLDAVRAANPGFPAWSTGKAFTGSLAGLTGGGKVITVIVWRDCSYYFDASKTLVGIDPGSNGTIDGVKPGSSPAAAKKVYGAPLATTKNSDGTYSVLYQADSAAKTKYQVIYSGDPATGGTVIKVIYLCTCQAPPVAPAITNSEIKKFDFGNTTWVVTYDGSPYKKVQLTDGSAPYPPTNMALPSGVAAAKTTFLDVNRDGILDAIVYISDDSGLYAYVWLGATSGPPKQLTPYLQHYPRCSDGPVGVRMAGSKVVVSFVTKPPNYSDGCAIPGTVRKQTAYRFQNGHMAKLWTRDAS